MPRPTIDADVVRRLLRAQFPQWADLPIQAVEPGGWDNRSFRIGEELVARLPSAKWYAAQAEKEQRWLPHLAPALPLPIPEPAGLGRPDEAFPLPWSICRWLPGETALSAKIADKAAFARDLAGFLVALQAADASDGPAAGAHNFFRGGSLATYDGEALKALEVLDGQVDTAAALATWRAALATAWERPAVWVHGDVQPGNLLVRDGRLSAVIDFGSCGVGDPACDLVMAWTFFDGEAREAFRAALPFEPGTWARARGWALWKALIVLAAAPGANPDGRERCPRIIADVLADHARAMS